MLKESLGKIQVSINNSDIDKGDILVTVFNPSPFARTEIVIAYIDIPKELEMKNFVMYDEDHNKIDYAMLVTKNSGKIFRDKTVIALHYDSPSIISIAICQGSRRPKIDYPPFEFYHFSKNQFKAGIGEIMIKGYKIRIYYPEKTICDCFRYRTKLGMP